jgi:hypothetical protein
MAEEERRSPFWRRDFLKSAPASAEPPDNGSETESIMEIRKQLNQARLNFELLNVNDTFFTERADIM